MFQIFGEVLKNSNNGEHLYGTFWVFACKSSITVQTLYILADLNIPFLEIGIDYIKLKINTGEGVTPDRRGNPNNRSVVIFGQLTVAILARRLSKEDAVFIRISRRKFSELTQKRGDWGGGQVFKPFFQNISYPYTLG